MITLVVVAVVGVECTPDAHARAISCIQSEHLSSSGIYLYTTFTLPYNNHGEVHVFKRLCKQASSRNGGFTELCM